MPPAFSAGFPGDRAHAGRSRARWSWCAATWTPGCEARLREVLMDAANDPDASEALRRFFGHHPVRADRRRRPARAGAVGDRRAARARGGRVKRTGLDLQLRFQVGILVVLGIVVLMMVMLWNRQQTSQREVVGIARQSDPFAAVPSRCGPAARRRCGSWRDALANPLYYFDLDAIGVLTRSALRAARRGLRAGLRSEGPHPARRLRRHRRLRPADERRRLPRRSSPPAGRTRARRTTLLDVS